MAKKNDNQENELLDGAAALEVSGSFGVLLESLRTDLLATTRELELVRVDLKTVAGLRTDLLARNGFDALLDALDTVLTGGVPADQYSVRANTLLGDLRHLLSQAADNRPAAVQTAGVQQRDDLDVRDLGDRDTPAWLKGLESVVSQAMGGEYDADCLGWAELPGGEIALGPKLGRKLPAEVVMAVGEAGKTLRLGDGFYIVEA